MNVEQLAAQLGAEVVCGGAQAASREILGGYASDLLSDVMANSREGDLWVTLQRHVNVVAVAQLKGLAGILLVNGRRPEPAAAERADVEGIPIVTTGLPAFEVIGRLCGMGIGRRRSG